jgi:hypothetical protein
MLLSRNVKQVKRALPPSGSAWLKAGKYDFSESRKLSSPLPEEAG